MTFKREDVRLLAPIPEPPQMGDFLCFEKHLRQAFEAVGKLRGAPARIPRSGISGTDTDVSWPRYCEKSTSSSSSAATSEDRARTSPRTARASTSLATPSQRLLGARARPRKGQGFRQRQYDGPCLVTADEIGDPYRLEMAVRVNGEEWGRGNLRDMHWKFEDCIAHASRSETLHPGEFFGSGTVGSGCGLEQVRFLNPADVVELEVEGIGVLRNRVV